MRMRRAIVLLSVLASAVVFAQQPHKQEPSGNFGLREPLDASAMPYSRTATVWPERVPQHAPEARLEAAAPGCWRLTGGWQLMESDVVAAADHGIFSPDFNPAEWYNAVVPGTVLTTLVQQGVYPDPYYGTNNMEIPENLCRKDWWYRSELHLDPAQLSARSLELVFEGINYRADVWLNGVRLGSIMGAFIRGSFDIKDLAGEDNVLAVHIYPPFNPGIPHEQSSVSGRGPNGGQLCLDGPTFISSEGWDWVPGVRDRNIGIWQDVLILTSGAVSIVDPQVITDLPLPSLDHADITVETELRNCTDADRDVTLVAELCGVRAEKRVTVPAGAIGKYRLSVDELPQLRIADPELWWPNGYGAQKLHTLKLSCIDGAETSDSREVRFGIREYSYELTVDTPTRKAVRIDYNPTALRGNTDIFNNRMLRDMGDGVSIPSLREGVDESLLDCIADDGMSPYLVIRCNGVRIFCKGGNWGMDDMMKYCSREHLEPYLKLHKEAGFTMVRNWTGESTEEVFYELCDEYGMLVWNDFWLSTEGYNLDPNDESLFMNNATDVVRRFRNHPSIAIWCPRNEGYATESLEKMICAMLSREDGTRHYHPNSRYCNLRPSGPWHYFEDASLYFSRQAKGFNTEQGSPSVPTARSMRRFLSDEDQWPISEAWHYHDLHPETKGYVAAVSALYGEATDLDDFCRKAQMINYDSYRAMFESWNSRLWNNTSGMLLWMSHPAWPSVEWQCYSWDCETFGSWFGCKKACEPLHIQLNLDDDTVCAVNATMKDETDLAATVSCYSLEGKLLYRRSEKISLLPANSATSVFRADLPQLSGNHMVRMTLTKGRQTVSINDYFRKGSDSSDFRALNGLGTATLKISSLKNLGKDDDGCTVLGLTVTNTSRCMAVAVKLDLLDAADGSQILPAVFSDGYFNLLPGQKRQLTVKYAGERNVSFFVEGYNLNSDIIR